MKSRYVRGLLQLAAACLLAHLFAQTNENVSLLRRFLEGIGLYDGRLYSPVNIIIMLCIAIAAILLAVRGFQNMWADRRLLFFNGVLTVVPFLIIAAGIVSFNFYHLTDTFFLSLHRGFSSIILEERGTNGIGYTGANNGGEDSGILVSMLKYSPGDLEFFFKIVDLDSNEEYVYNNAEGEPQRLRWPDGLNEWERFIHLSRLIPGYVETDYEKKEFRYKIVLYNETESKTLYRYFGR